MRQDGSIIRSACGSSVFHAALLMTAFWVYDPVELTAVHYEEGVRRVLATTRFEPPPEVEPKSEPPPPVVKPPPPKKRRKKVVAKRVEKPVEAANPEVVEAPQKTPPKEKVRAARKAGLQKIGAKSKSKSFETAAASVADSRAPAAAPSAVTRAPAAGPKAKKVSSKVLIRQYYGTLSTFLRRNYAYPKRARLAAIEGTVLVEIVVDKDGKVVARRVARSSGHEILDQAALAAIANVRSVPRPPEGLAWNQRAIRVPFRYSLKT